MPLTLAVMAPREPGSEALAKPESEALAVSGSEALAEPEIFASIQGEGPSAGLPVSFIRLSRCNLACVWCDTAYTWRFEGDRRPHRAGAVFSRRANQVTLSEVEAARRIAQLGQPRLVITGGEPLLQAAALARMLEHLPGIAVEVETNGTIDPAAALDGHVERYNVSFKLAHSGNASERALPPGMIARWAQDGRAAFKFVIGAPEDIVQVRALADAHGIAPSRIWLMAEGTDSATLHQRMRWLAPIGLKHGFRLSDRLHIHLFGDTRGT